MSAVTIVRVQSVTPSKTNPTENRGLRKKESQVVSVIKNGKCYWPNQEMKLCYRPLSVAS
jgi:hypothetical protein